LDSCFEMILSFGLRPFILSASRLPNASPSSSGRRMGSLLTLGAAVGAPLALGQVMGLLSAPDVATWYPKLEKPSWTPPVALFPIIWSSLYFLMGLASHRAWLSGAGAGTLGLYALQLGLNLAWQPLVRLVVVFKNRRCGFLSVALFCVNFLYFLTLSFYFLCSFSKSTI
jgi:tryptophan-rich sensory protein